MPMCVSLEIYFLFGAGGLTSGTNNVPRIKSWLSSSGDRFRSKLKQAVNKMLPVTSAARLPRHSQKKAPSKTTRLGGGNETWVYFCFLLWSTCCSFSLLCKPQFNEHNLMEAQLSALQRALANTAQPASFSAPIFNTAMRPLIMRGFK